MPGANQRLAAAWQDQELAVAVQRAARVGETPVWIDRRVDRQQLITLALQETTVSEALEQIAGEGGYEAVPWQGVVIVAPAGAADEIATLALIARKQLGQGDAPWRRPWLAPESASWSRLTEPRDLLRQWLGPLGLSDAELQRVPHDLLPAGSLPAMSPLDRATALLAGFDLALQFDRNGAPKIRPLERPVRITRTYRIRPQTADSFNAAVSQLVRGGRAEIVAPADAVPANGVAVATSVAGHAQLDAARSSAATGRGMPSVGDSAPAGRTRRSSPQTERRYTLRIERQPLGPVLDQLAAQLGVEFVWGEGVAAADYRGRRVSCDVRDATRADLLSAILRDAGLKCTESGDDVTLAPAGR